MKFIPKEIKDNVNVSRFSTSREFFRLIVEILGTLLLIYIALGFVVDYYAPRMSPAMELKISKIFTAKFEKKIPSQTEQQVQEILNDLVGHADLPKFTYAVHVQKSHEINAMAFPAGHIVVYTPLLKEVKSKNELAMVLAHELGHFAHRDHLRGLGRGLVFLVLSSVTFGADSAVSKFIGNMLTSVEMKFSQAQEKAADIYALELLYKTYANAAGAVDFYEKMAAKEKINRIFYFLATHPYIKDRIATINAIIKEKGYAVGEKTPIEFVELNRESESGAAKKKAGD